MPSAPAPFGEIWRTKDAAFWDWMWRNHRSAPLTQALLDRLSSSASLAEVGCGYGHFLAALHDRGFRGTYIGFDLSAPGALATRSIGQRLGLRTEVVAGDFLEHVSTVRRLAEGTDPETPTSMEASVAHGVVIHQAHWAPTVLAMLRMSEVAMVGIRYVDFKSDYHRPVLRPAGHYDTTYSVRLLEREAEAIGLSCELEAFVNPSKGRGREVLATFRMGR